MRTDTDRLNFQTAHPLFRLAGGDAAWWVWDSTNGFVPLGKTKPTAREAIDSAMDAYEERASK